MWISYSHSEINSFHPVCETALNLALTRLGLANMYSVKHHQYTGSLEMDFVLQNNATGKYLCVIEVKRTPADVNSARYQYQAMSYVQMNTSLNEHSFYILTNLEYAYSFRYDASRPKVFQQILKPGFTSVGNFATDSESELTSKLANYFSAQITAFQTNSYEYSISLEQFIEHMTLVKKNPKLWKSSIAVLLYEYIRGAFTFIHRNELKDIRLFHNDVERICKEASRVNFKEIFEYDPIKYAATVSIGDDIFSSLFDLGRQTISGDSIASTLHQIVSEGHEHEGEVPTDLELSRVVAQLAFCTGGGLQGDECLCDPAAGSGNLLSSAIDVFNMRAQQIIANDTNAALLELLSLRLGLSFVKTVTPSNSPTICNQNIADLTPTFFENVRVILMNPPFVAGINCVDKKQPLYNAIRRLTANAARTSSGQMPFEAVFLELIILLVKPGTTVACIFPKSHLTARGVEAQKIRQLLLDRFGLQLVFTYPGSKLFEGVMRDTCILIGQTSHPVATVKAIASYEAIPDIDLQRFTQSLQQNLPFDFIPTAPGIVAKSIPLAQLQATVTDGWRTLNSEMSEAFVYTQNELLPRLMCLDKKNWPMKRGSAGNSGGSDLLFFDTRPELYTRFSSKGIVVKAGMRNAKHGSFRINGGDSAFLDITANTQPNISNIIDTYMTLPERSGRQQRKKKTFEKWEKILTSESKKVFKKYSVLIPRGIRRTGRVYFSDEDVFVSTNFCVITLPSLKDAICMSTWMATIFYQLICEVSSKNQDGMRKMEISDISKTFIPNFTHVTNTMLSELQAEIDTLEFLDLQNPGVRPIDIIWAEYLFAANSTNELDKANRLLQFLATQRNA